MKKILIAAAALATVAGAAGAAQAQSYGSYGYGDRYDRYERRYDSRALNDRQHALRVAVDRGIQSGRLTYREGQALRGEIQAINRLERQYRNRGGLNPNEANILNARLDNLERRLSREMRDGQRYGYGYGRGW